MMIFGMNVLKKRLSMLLLIDELTLFMISDAFINDQ